MWKDFRPKEIVGEDTTIDKLELVKDFLNDCHCREIALTSRKSLSVFLKNKIGAKPGVYCIYDKKKKEVLYVGESRKLGNRIHAQLAGREDKEEHVLKFARLFYAVLKTDIKKGMKQKEYRDLHPKIKKKLVKSYLDIIFRSNNVLRICFTKETTKEDLRAFVLEQTLIEYFQNRGQCKYNIQGRIKAKI